MGGFTSLFTGNTGSYDAPALVQSDPAPVREAAVEPEANAARNEERRRIRSRRAMNGTLLSQPLGGSGGSGLLGVSMGGQG